MSKNLVIGLLGHRNSGKSTTWYRLFEGDVKTGSKIRHLYFSATEYVEVFLVNGSPEERETYVGEIINDLKPRIILCSMQYTRNVTETVDYFVENGYHIYVQWLNPGAKDQNESARFDYLGILNMLLALNSTISIRNGKDDPDDRVREIRDYIYGWASSRNLILKV
jgi:hypothetical protein